MTQGEQLLIIRYFDRLVERELSALEAFNSSANISKQMISLGSRWGASSLLCINYSQNVKLH